MKDKVAEAKFGRWCGSPLCVKRLLHSKTLKVC